MAKEREKKETRNTGKFTHKNGIETFNAGVVKKL